MDGYKPQDTLFEVHQDLAFNEMDCGNKVSDLSSSPYGEELEGRCI